MFLDGGYTELAGAEDDAPSFRGLGHLQTREVAAVLEQTMRKMLKYLKRRKLLADADAGEEAVAASSAEMGGHAELIGSAVSRTQPPAGPSFPVRIQGMLAHPRISVSRSADFERLLCVGRDGFTLHAATRAGGADAAGREALLKYILRPVVARERIVLGKDGLVRILLKRAFSDRTVAIDLDPLSLLSRLGASVPAPRFHTVRYGGVLASASKLRPKIAPKEEGLVNKGPEICVHGTSEREMPPVMPKRDPYRPWAELLKRTFSFDVLLCPVARARAGRKAIAGVPLLKVNRRTIAVRCDPLTFLRGGLV